MRAKAAPRAPADLAQAVPLKAPHMIPGEVPWTAFGTVAGTFEADAPHSEGAHMKPINDRLAQNAFGRVAAPLHDACATKI